MSLINKVDITKFSDEELQAISAESKLRIHLQAKNSNLRDHLWALVRAVGRLLDDKYSEGDEKVRNQLWTDMHRTGDRAREYLQNSEPLEAGEIEKLRAENEKMRKALEDDWVRVEDRLPGFKEPTRIPRAGQYPFVVIDVIDHNQYLVYTTCEVFELANFEKDGTWSFNNAEDEKVTHWRPLPALPIATSALKTNTHA